MGTHFISPATQCTVRGLSCLRLKRLGVFALVVSVATALPDAGAQDFVAPTSNSGGDREEPRAIYSSTAEEAAAADRALVDFERGQDGSGDADTAEMAQVEVSPAKPKKKKGDSQVAVQHRQRQAGAD